MSGLGDVGVVVGEGLLVVVVEVEVVVSLQ